MRGIRIVLPDRAYISNVISLSRQRIYQSYDVRANSLSAQRARLQRTRYFQTCEATMLYGADSLPCISRSRRSSAREARHEEEAGTGKDLERSRQAYTVA